MKGLMIGVKEDYNTFTIEKEFQLKTVENSILKVTSLGIYFVTINGKRVGDAYLTPGWTSYHKVLQVQTYDVTNLLHVGHNKITITINEGWYKGPLTWDLIKDVYGNKIGAIAHLQSGDFELVTDLSWSARESQIVRSGLYEGEIIDYTSKLKKLNIEEIPFNKSVLVNQQCEYVKDIEYLKVVKVIKDEDDIIFDFGQNLVGVVQINTPNNYKGTFTVKYAEVLINGKFYTENLRKAKATDTFTVDGPTKIIPEFTFHGFRYVMIKGLNLEPSNIKAIVRHSDLRKTGYIHTSNPRFNRLMDNVVWGQRGNFVDIPTDCPQRDERLGWTGDINAFCPTAAFNYDIRNFMKKWLKEVRLDQTNDGLIPFVAPNLLDEWHGTSALWCDCITMIPWLLYQVYDDISFLEDNYEAIKKFVFARYKTIENGLICKGHEYGDWLALDNEQLVQCNYTGRTDIYYIANVFGVHSFKLAYLCANVLNHQDDAKIFKQMYEDLLTNVRDEYFTKNGRLCFDTVTAQTLALYFDIVKPIHKESLAKALNENVKRHGFKVVTGFIGTPYLLFALSDNGYIDTASRVLMYNGLPGWLYEVDMGATTVWERWDSLRCDGNPNLRGMNSYNHYAYGCVMEFVYKKIIGIEMVDLGYKKVKIAPHPCPSLKEAFGSYDSVNGKITSGYIQKNGEITFYGEVAPNIEATFVFPDLTEVKLKHGKYSFTIKYEELSDDPFTINSTSNEIINNPLAKRSFEKVFGEILFDENNGFSAYPVTLGDLKVMFKIEDFEQKLKQFNEEFLKLPR